VLTLLLDRLQQVEGFDVKLVGGAKVYLKSSPGPINPKYPHFRLTRPGSPPYDVWTDVEFATMSYHISGSSGLPGQAHRHELDVLIVKGGVASYPAHTDIVLGVECKNTGFKKGMARAALGLRRELSLLTTDKPTPFISWPRLSVPADTPSVLMAFSTDPTATSFNDAGGVFGVDFCYEPMP
jgi:hypothetical protein